MRLNQTLLAIAIAGGLALAGEAQANIIYDVNLAIGAGGVVGTITTDGRVGVIGASNILAWNLTVTGKGGATFILVNGPSGVACGNKTAVFNPNAGTPDLTADANHIYFNFDATDGGYLGFQTLPFYGGNNYWSCGAKNNSNVEPGLSAVPVLYSDPSSIYVAKSGNQIIASVATAGTQPNSFVYNNFATTKLLRFNGSATKVTTSDGPVLELTPASANQAGSAFTSNHIVLAPNAGFGTFFTFRLSKPGNAPAGGITFTIQSAGSSSLGNSGSGLGYSGITNSLSVGFGADNHVSVNINGVLNAASVTNNAMNDGDIWYAWVDYSGVRNLLEVRVSEIPVRPTAPTLATVVNLPLILGSNIAFVGFTGGTGAGWNQQDILSWKFMALPTTRFTGHYALTNVTPSFRLTNGLAIKQFTYTVGGVSFTNLYTLEEEFTKEPDGSVDFVTLPESTPFIDLTGFAIDEGAITQVTKEATEMGMLSEYANTDPGMAGKGLALTMSGAVPEGQTFEAGFPGLTEPWVQTELEALNADLLHLPAPPTDPNQAMILAEFAIREITFLVELSSLATKNAILGGGGGSPFSTPMTSVEYEMNAINGLLQQQIQCQQEAAANIVSFSGATNRGTVLVREQLLSGPPLLLQLLSPRMTGTNFSFVFLTVSNQSYTVWNSTNLMTTNWVNYTNVLGDGYVQRITAPSTDSPRRFYRVSSP